jgi:putative tryptophan/tyrosine transport system substrate-binding protein
MRLTASTSIGARAIVFVQVAEPVGAGFVETLPRPGGNATGFMLFASPA